MDVNDAVKYGDNENYSIEWGYATWTKDQPIDEKEFSIRNRYNLSDGRYNRAGSSEIPWNDFNLMIIESIRRGHFTHEEIANILLVIEEYSHANVLYNQIDLDFNKIKGAMKSELSKLCVELELIDEPRKHNQFRGLELLVVKDGIIRLDIHPESGTHSLPHFHILYKQEFSASYQIDPLQKLAGEVPDKYERKLLEWANNNKSLLLEAWKTINIEGKKPDHIISI